MEEAQCGVYEIKYIHRKVSVLIKFGTIGGTLVYQFGVRKNRFKMADVWYSGMVSVVLLYFTIKDFVIENASALGQRLHGSVGTGLCQSRVHCPLLC
jgi:hypothetical protein